MEKPNSIFGQENYRTSSYNNDRVLQESSSIRLVPRLQRFWLRPATWRSCNIKLRWGPGPKTVRARGQGEAGNTFPAFFMKKNLAFQTDKTPIVKFENRTFLKIPHFRVAGLSLKAMKTKQSPFLTHLVDR